MTVLSVAQGVAAVVGLDIPETVFGDTDRTGVELQHLANDTAEFIAEGHDWPQLALSLPLAGGFTGLPADFARFALDHGVVNENGRILTGYRLADNGIYYDGDGTARYQSNFWAIDDVGNRKDRFTSDTDRYELPERLLRLAMVWKWKANKGLPHEQDFADFERAKVLAIGTTGAREAIAIGRPARFRDVRPAWVNIDMDAP